MDAIEIEMKLLALTPVERPPVPQLNFFIECEGGRRPLTEEETRIMAAVMDEGDLNFYRGFPGYTITQKELDEALFEHSIDRKFLKKVFTSIEKAEEEIETEEDAEHDVSSDEDDGAEDAALYSLFKLSINYAEGMDLYDVHDPPTDVVTFDTRSAGAISKERVIKYGRNFDTLTKEEAKIVSRVFFDGRAKKNLKEALETSGFDNDARYKELGKQSFDQFYLQDEAVQGMHAQFMHACKKEGDATFNKDINHDRYKNWPCLNKIPCCEAV